MSGFQPELGQAVFGQPYKQCGVPDIMYAALEAIRNDVSRVLWNLRQEEIDPFGNSGASFRCDTFCVCAYSWDDEIEQPWNFKHLPSGVEISWYKYCGRGMSANQAISADMAAEILRSCLEAMRRVETGEMKYDEPGLYPDAPTNLTGGK